jgi:hypothetical protein
MISLVRVNSLSFLRSKRRIISLDLRRRKERGLSVNVASPNRHICEVVFELREDVGLKAGGQIDSAERSLAGMVAHRHKLAHKASQALGIHCRSP